MNIITEIFKVTTRIPGWIWIVLLLCIIVPTIWYCVKRSAKVVGWVICILAILFIFPNIIASFMQTTGLTYDNKTGILTNSNGQSIQLLLPEKEDEATEEELQALLKQLKDSGLTVDDLLKSAGQVKELGEQLKKLQEEVEANSEGISFDDLTDNVTY